MIVKINKTEKTILFLLAIMTFVLITFDIKQWIKTPLSHSGTNHWIPEFFTLVCLGYWITDKFGSFTTKIIAGCVLLYSISTYILMNQPITFSIGTGTFFVAAIILGIWIKVSRGTKQ
jgi:hypothetical protein